MNILVFNAGSSSLKFALFRSDAEIKALLTGDWVNLGADGSRFVVKDATGDALVEDDAITAPEQAAGTFIDLVRQQGFSTEAVGHRIVHGGIHVRQHCVMTDEIFLRLEDSALFSPLHGPLALKVAHQTMAAFPEVPHIACLDTAFHRDLPDVARHFPLPAEFAERGLIRYGFHGLSCESVVHRLRFNLPDKLVIAHLGSGCSITAVRAGKSVDTSMGLTPTGGVMMATRSGDLDPGLLLYLLRTGFDSERIEHLLDTKSGLAGVSGISGDMRELKDSSRGAFAISLFCYALQKQIAAMVAALQGLDMLVFTGGIGAHDKILCRRIAGQLTFLGPIQWQSMVAEEELAIAAHVRSLT
jgi:acetate kinase